ncbi:hypothetical protein [Owenweeksia hongkongensis]|uniref:hypothetical protein n=1 Tax=Owenweeksia hongkongensis TaxID=253245 RepID=UPI003A8EF4C2
MTVEIAREIDHVESIIKQHIEDSLVVPILNKNQKGKILFFGTFKNHRFRLFTVPSNPWIKSPRTPIIITLHKVAGADKTLFIATFPKTSKFWLLVLAVSIFLALLGWLFADFTLLSLSCLGIFSGGLSTIFRIIAFDSNSGEANRRLQVLIDKLI